MTNPGTKYTCPVCGYDELDEPPYSESGQGSYDICPQCRIEFGVYGAATYLEKFDKGRVYSAGDKLNGTTQERLDELHRLWREDWIAGRRKWWSFGRRS